MTCFRNLVKSSLLLAASLGAMACGPSFELATPPGFVEIDQTWDNYDLSLIHISEPTRPY